MILIVWTQPSGYNLGSFEQGITLNPSIGIPLPVENDSGVSYKIISGSLPSGLAIRGNHITGTPFLVSNNPKFTFCIRASKGTDFADRTFTMNVYTTARPEFITGAGELPIGLGGQLYVLDSTYVDYQLEAYDYNTTTGHPLTYYIADGDGSLPPGLSLSDTGLIQGFIEPRLIISKADGTGTFDESLFDKVAFDFGRTPTDGYDSYLYDNVFYDFNTPTLQPKSLSANYQFKVTLSDGVNLTQRVFRIFVVGTDEFHADSTTLDGLAGNFNADASFVRAPVWITNSNLGAFRANNYITIPMALYDTSNVEFNIVDASKLPPGLRFDANTGDLYGVVPYQPSVTKSYSFTITATRLDGNDSVTTSKTFTMIVLGTINSEILWKTPNNLGTIPANYISTLSVSASSNIADDMVVYELTSGSLPIGLTLNVDGEIIGTPNQFYDRVAGRLGLTTFDGGSTKFDHTTTTFERRYTFGITAKNQYGYSAVTRTFTVTIAEPNTTTYSNITTRPMLIPSQRLLWHDFINNTSIFNPTSIYRPNDKNFGLQSGLTMLVYAGIQTEVAAAYVGAMGLNHKKKCFQFGGIQKAIANDPTTHNEVYEVVYIQMVDALEPNGIHLPEMIKSDIRYKDTITIDQTIGVDSTGYQISSPNTNEYFPNSICNWRERLSKVGLNERNYLPLWMRSIGSGQKEELGYTLAIPLCFCKPGTADTIITAIKLSGFDFKAIDYTIDRYTINAVLNSQGDVVYGDKYLVFKNDRITV
jgi:hypothetical protein